MAGDMELVRNYADRFNKASVLKLTQNVRQRLSRESNVPEI